MFWVHITRIKHKGSFHLKILEISEILFVHLAAAWLLTLVLVAAAVLAVVGMTAVIVITATAFCMFYLTTFRAVTER